MPKRTIEALVKEKYGDPEVADFILDDVKRRNTGDKIVSGELVLPSEEDAERNHQIATGTFHATERERELIEENQRLRAQSQQHASGENG